MASGKKNYFRHSINARNDEVLIDAMNKFGPKAYFFWFALLEICAEQWCQDSKVVFIFHESRLYQELKCNRRTLKPLLNYFQSSSKLVWNQSGTSLKVEIPKLLEYIGSYGKNSPNKRKEKERKEKETKVNETNTEFKNLNSGTDVPMPKKQAEVLEKKVVDKKKSSGNLQAQAFIKTYCELFKQRWNVNPVIRSKQSGIAKRLSTEMSLERFTFLLKAFFAMPDAWNVKQKHPLEIFVTKLNEIVVYAELGEFQTQTKSRQNDESESVKDQLRRIDRGEL